MAHFQAKQTKWHQKPAAIGIRR